MSVSSWVTALAAGIATLGCAAPPQQGFDGCNPGGVCRAEVTVGPGCAIAVRPDPMLVPLPRGAKRITWEIVSDGYVFAENGIAWKTPGDEFVGPEPAGKRFTWTDRHTRAGDFPYTVTVVGAGANPKVCIKDPLITNQ